jgi:hypothetical protein
VSSAENPGDIAGPNAGLRSSSVESELRTEAYTVVSVNIRWESALPLRQAHARERYGEDALKAGTAAKALERDEPNYVIVLSGFPPLNERRIPGGLDRAFLENTKLVVKGQEPRRPLDVDIAPRGRILDVALSFPKLPAITTDDQEVELSVSAGRSRLTHRFRPKDMLFQGVLGL